MQVASRQPTEQHDVVPASKIIGEAVVNRRDEDLGKIHELVIDPKEGRVAYAVLASGGCLGMGDRLFAMPWSAFEFDSAAQRLILDVDKDVLRLKASPGFDKDARWPDFADRIWGNTIHGYYGYRPYWQQPD